MTDDTDRISDLDLPTPGPRLPDEDAALHGELDSDGETIPFGAVLKLPAGQIYDAAESTLPFGTVLEVLDRGALDASGWALEDPLGSGGASHVYRARRADGTQAAVKLGETLAPRTRERFLREVEILQTIDHPHVVRGLGHGLTQDGRPWIALELVEGDDLAERLELEGALPVRQAAQILLGIARGLRAVHAAGVVHRDLKPANVLLDEDDAVKLADFGLARLEGAQPITLVGQTLGTPRYAAPEQIRAEPATPATDVYALGLIAYEALTGAPPFGGDAREVLVRHLEAPAPALEVELDTTLASLLRRCLDKDPADRPALDRLERALHAVSEGRPARRGISERLAAGLEAATRRLRRRP